MLFVSLPVLLEIIIEAVAFLILVILAGGKKRNVLIMALYLWNVSFLIDVVIFCLLGITANLPMSYTVFYSKLIIVQIGVFLWALFYYSLMRSIPQEALNRITLSFRLVVLIIPIIGTAVVWAIYNPITIKEVNINNFIICSFLGITLIVLNILIIFLFLKFFVSNYVRFLADGLSKNPPAYTLQNGLSPEFIEEYDLSKRQVKVAEALLQGKSNKEIASLLNIEVNTVQVHLQNLYRKTGTQGRYALMALVGLGKK